MIGRRKKSELVCLEHLISGPRGVLALNGERSARWEHHYGHWNHPHEVDRSRGRKLPTTVQRGHHMNGRIPSRVPSVVHAGDRAAQPGGLHPNWMNLIKFCSENPFASLRLNIADGVPVSAEDIVPHLRFDRPNPRGSARRPSTE